jgi:hypothetical protein
VLNKKEKRAIENLLILASYIKDHSIYSGKQVEIIDHSIEVAETLVGKRINDSVSEIDLGPCSTEAIIKAIANRFKP